MAQNEAFLLKRFTGSGDAEAFAEIIRRHAGLVYGAALRILADVDRASDVAQETFLQLTKDAGHVTGSLPGWLHRVATHKAIDLRRREASRRQREKAYTAHEPPGESSEWKEISAYVDAGLRELPPELRDVLILHFLQGRTTREIALLQGASQATVSRRIGAGVQQLRAKLRKRGVLIAVVTLSALLGDNGVQAAPLPLLTELGKMALVGGGAAGAAGAGSGLHTAVTSVLATAKTKAVAVAAVTIIGAGVIVTCYEVMNSASAPAVTAPVESNAASLARRAAASPAPLLDHPTPRDALPAAEMKRDAPPVAAAPPARPLDRDIPSAAKPRVHPVPEGMELAFFAGAKSGGMGGSAGTGDNTGMTVARGMDSLAGTGGVGGATAADPAAGSTPAPAADPNLHDPNAPPKP